MVKTGDKQSAPGATAHLPWFLLLARGMALATALLSCIVLLGWATGRLDLASIYHKWPPMVPNTALCFLLGSLALLLHTWQHLRPAALFLSALLLLGGAVFSAEWVLDADWGIRYWLFGDALRQSAIYRVAPGTAAGFILLGGALLLHGWRRWPLLTELLLQVLGALALLRLAAFPFGVIEFTALKGFRTMAALTSICFTLLWIGALALRGRRGVLGLLLSRAAGGRMARRLLLAALLIPFLNGWLRVRLLEIGSVREDEASVLSALLNAMVFSAFVIWAAWQLDNADAARSRHERQLARSEARLRRLFESPLLGVFYWNLKGETLDANQRYLDMLGYTREDLKAGRLSWTAQTPAEYHEIELEKTSEIVRTGSLVPYEKEFLSAAGERIPVVLGAAMLDAEAQEGVAFVLDNSERLRALKFIEQRSLELAEANRRISQAADRLRAVLDAAQDAVVSMDRTGRIVEWNRGSEALLGWSAAEALGQPVTIIMPEQYREGHRNGLALFLESGEGPVIGKLIEIEALHRDGRIIPVELSVGQPVGSGDGLLFTAFLTDISERRAAQEMIAQRNVELEILNAELQRSEARMRALFESPMIGVYFWRIDGSITEANEHMLRITGFTAADVAAGKLTWQHLAGPAHEDYPALAAEILRQRGGFGPSETVVLRSDGSPMPVLTGAFMVDREREDGIAFMLEVTAQHDARRQIEERNAALQSSEARIRAIFESPLTPMAFWRADGTITEANQRFLELTGYSAEQIAAREVNWAMLTPPELQGANRQRSQRLARERVIEPEEDLLLRADGSQRHVLAGGALLPGSEEECVAFLLDITEQYQTRETIRQRNAELEALTAELERSQAHLKQLFDSPMLGILHWSAEGKILSANDRLLAMTGFSREDFEAGRFGWEHIAPPEFAEIDATKMQSLVSRGKMEPYEKEFICADGSRLPVLVGAATLDMAKGEGVAYALDASELRAQREEIELRNAELQRINAELDSFSYSVSHDLRAPLRAVEGFSKALEEDYGSRLDEDAQRYLARIRAGTVRMAQLIDDLLQLSRVGRAELSVQLVDLSDLTQAVRLALTESAPERSVEWRVQPGLLAQGDPRLLRIVLDNLLGNAFKFSSARETARIEFGQVVTDRGMAYVVRDNGDGFDMAYAGKLFTAFQRLHQQEQFPGTGIGLSIVRRIVSRHGGDVWAESAPGSGAAFYFTLRLGERNG